jgi:protein-disulfide reductase (glutathione)
MSLFAAPSLRRARAHRGALATALAVTLAAFLLFVGAASAGEADGWGDHGWVRLPQAFSIARAQNKPVAVVIWKSWCGACKALKPKVAASTAIAALAGDFVMVAADEDEPKGDEAAKYSPDGGYYPRVLFFHSTGELMEDVVGPNPKYKHYFSDDSLLAKAMAAAKETAKRGRAGAAGEL